MGITMMMDKGKEEVEVALRWWRGLFFDNLSKMENRKFVGAEEDGEGKRGS